MPLRSSDFADKAEALRRAARAVSKTSGSSNGARWPSRSSKSVAPALARDGLGSTPRRFRQPSLAEGERSLGEAPGRLARRTCGRDRGPGGHRVRIALHRPAAVIPQQPSRINRIAPALEHVSRAAVAQLVEGVAAGRDTDGHGADGLRARHIVRRVADDDDVGRRECRQPAFARALERDRHERIAIRASRRQTRRTGSSATDRNARA